MVTFFRRILRLLVVLFLLGLTAMGFALVRDRGFPALGVLPARIADMTCDQLEGQAEGLELKNQLGGTSAILKAYEAKEIRRTSDTLVCISMMLLDTGERAAFTLSAETIDGELFIRVGER